MLKLRFLKLGDDLARSTVQLSTKRESGTKKIFEISDVVKLAKSSTGVTLKVSRPAGNSAKKATFKDSLLTIEK